MKNLRIIIIIFLASTFCVLEEPTVRADWQTPPKEDFAERGTLASLVREATVQNEEGDRRFPELEGKMLRWQKEDQLPEQEAIEPSVREDVGFPGLEGQMFQWEKEAQQSEREAVEPSVKEAVDFPELEGEAIKWEKEAEKPAEGAAEEDKKLGAWINEYVEFGGAIEVEAFWEKDFEKKSTSDISLETAELDFEIVVTDWARGVLAIEWLPEEDKFTVKEAFVTFGNTEACPIFLQTGRLFVPFGIGTGAVVGDTLSLSDPLTIEIFETREDVIMLGIERNGFHTAAYVFNGDTNHRRRINGNGEKNDHIEHFGATLRYSKDTIEENRTALSIGFDMISSVFDSDELSEVFPEALVSHYAPGIAAHIRYFKNGFSFIAEYNGAVRTVEFTTEDEDLKLAPKAWQVELGYETEILCKDAYIAFNYSESFDLHGTFPKNRFLATVGIWLYTDMLLALEYSYNVDYSKSKGGTGNSANAVISQLTFEW